MLHHIPLRQKIITMLAVMSGLFLVALDQTIVSTALGRIVEDFDSFSSLSWVVTAYLLGNTVTVPIAGKLSDLFGRRLVLMIGVAIFTIASLFSGSAGDINQLILFRAIQGIGGGIIMANAFTIVGDLFSPRERGRWQGLIGAVFAIASVVGPLLGGYLTDNQEIFGLITSWRWNFWLNVPIGIAAFSFIAKYCPTIKHDHKPAIDYLGAGTLAVTLSSLILAVDNTEKIFAGLVENGIAASTIKLVLYGLALIAGILFIWFETKAEEPIIPLEFFKNRNFPLIVTVALLFGAAFLGAIIYLTQYNLQVFGVSPTTAGLMLLPMIGGLTITSALTGQLVTKTGRYKPFFISGLAIATVSVAFLTTLTPDTPYWHEAIMIGFVGIGLGTGMPIINLAVQNEFEQKHLGAATASAQLFRGLGSTIGVAMLGAMLTAGITVNLGDMSQQKYIQTLAAQPGASQLIEGKPADVALNLNTRTIKDKLNSKLEQSLDQSNLPPAAAEQAQASFAKQQANFSNVVAAAFSKALSPLFMVSAILMATATTIALFLKERPLKGRSGDTPGV